MKISNCTKICLLSCVSIISCGTHAVVDGFNLSDTGEEDLLFADIDSVFSASKYEQKITEAPARISIVTSDEIKRLGFRSFTDVLNSLPGFQTNYDRVYTYVGTRGFSVSGDYNARILMLVDGHRINENVYGGMLIDDGLSVNINLIERIEVVRGSASSLYGNNAFFGVINIITKSGRDIQGLEFIGGQSSQDRKEATLSYGDKFNNGVEVLVSGSIIKTDGHDRLYFPEFDQPQTNDGVAENNDGAKSNSLHAKLNYQNLVVNASHVKHLKVDPTAAFDSVFNDARTLSEEAHDYIDLTYQTLLSNGQDITSRIYYDQYKYYGSWVYDYSELGDLSDLILWEEQTEGSWWGAEFISSQYLFENHYVTWGLEYIDSTKEKQLSYDPYDIYLDLQTSNSIFALYIQDEFNLSEQLKLNLGVRYDKYQQLSGEINYRLAAIWSLSEQSTLKLIHGTAFRAPNAYERYYHDNNVSQKVAGPLSPEEISSKELIFENLLNDNLRWVVSLYDNHISDLINLSLDPADDLVFFSNKNKASARGGEIELVGQWESNWSGSISYANQQPATNSDENIINIPKHQIKFTAVTPQLWLGFNAGVTVQYESGRKTLEGSYTNDSILTHLTVSQLNLLPNLTLSGSIYNLFDEAYSFPGSEEHLQNEIEQDGRSFRLQISYIF